ncbi:hypothetical protein JTE90_001469 [Oedothorax gibbosus]|uniref:tRNA-splicing endonuclease subunit Sen2 n=1 Tax=Oedothorax gibbosus TaxID=931172 RepID=A0AAV6UCR6_9ARAC|nr:hypothetical protein JTE90_001469 [Oedothorax gibbosus]
MEDNTDNLLLKPAAKKTKWSKEEYPFPIICNDNIGDNQIDPEWKCAEGYLEDNCVLIHDEKSIKLLYTKGFFGKGTLSNNAPRICCKKQIHHDKGYKKRDRKRKRLESPSPSEELQDEEIICVEDDDEAPKPKNKDIEVVLSDSDLSSEDSETQQEESGMEQPDSVEKESLQLTFEEAYFLSYGLGCLVVKERNQPLNLSKLWNKFCERSADKNFPVMYTAYHHFRSKGWIVRCGLKYGVDYVLYKDGPPFYHSTYSVIVKAVKEQGLREERGQRQFTWGSLLALNRVTNTVGKGLMFLYVIKPHQVSEQKIITPFCISQYKVEEVLMKRWVPSASREEKD